MSDYLLVTEGVAPLVEDASAHAAVGLARALIARRHRVGILTLATADAIARVPGLARRLRTVTAAVGDERLELPFFEGRFSTSDPTLFVLQAPPAPAARRAALLGSSAVALAADAVLKPDVLVGWGEAGATALVRLSAAFKLFVLPSGALGAPLAEGEADALHLGVDGDAASARSLASIGALAAHAVIVPSPTAARQLERHAGLAGKATDEPIVALRFGCDEPPFDPGADPALVAFYSADAPEGKAQARRALARRLSLAVGPRTLLVGVGPLQNDAGSDALLTVARQLAGADVATVIDAGGDKVMTEKARVLSIEQPSRVALVDLAGDSPAAGLAAQRAWLAALDARVFTGLGELSGRPAHLALRYGVLPLVPATDAYADYLVDVDPASETGQAILYPQTTVEDLDGAIARAVALRARADAWARLVPNLMRSAPTWERTATIVDSLAAEGEAATPVVPAA